MKYIKRVVVLLALSMSIPASFANAQEIDKCDIEAAHPSDPDHVGDGKMTENVDTFAAIAVCRAAVKKHPKTPRFHYQLGRALVYQGDFLEGKDYIAQAADMDYMQAQFVLGLLTKGVDSCKGESLIRAAADQGLKSARITYVNDSLDDVYVGCEPAASKDDLLTYLKDAEEQMSGYYETLLASALKRELLKSK